MNPNVGTVDRIFRIVLGLVLISLVFVGPQTPWGWVGVILVATGFIKFCPIYAALRIRTNKSSEA